MERSDSLQMASDDNRWMADRRVVFVHAHPDDEALQTGGTIARYADEGAHVCLVTCTNGELGEIAEVPELGPVDEIQPRLGEIRRGELEEACRRLGAVDLRMLGFHDSGMEGTPTNDDPGAFVNQDIEDVTREVVTVLREVQPQVVVTYNAYGFYGHPDHIRAHDATLRAIDALANVHEVAKLYYTAFPKSFMRLARDTAEQFGLGRDDFFSEDDVDRIGTDDADITTTIDVAAFIDRKMGALQAHQTQLGTIGPLFAIPQELRDMALGAEHYVLARSTIPRSQEVETDLFEGLV